MKFFYYLISCAFLSLLHAQDGTFSLGARNAGLAGTSVTLNDEFSLFNNVGGLAGVKNHAVFTSYQNRYSISEFQVIGGGGIWHHRLGNAGIGYYKFGDDLFSQQRLHFAIGNSFQMVSLGLAVDWIQYHIETIGSQQVLAIQFGGIAELKPQLLFGAHIFNINQATLISETEEQLPTVMKAGMSYRPTNELMLNTEVEKDLDFDEVFKAGIEYQIVENIFIRTGFNTRPFLGTFGLGFHPKRFKFDYAFSNRAGLGTIHELSLAYGFNG